MIVVDGQPVIYSASDLTSASACEWALMHKLDARLGRVQATVPVPDEMLDRAAVLGDAHELRVLERLRRERTVVEIARPERPDEIAGVAAQTAQAFLDGADVVYQAAFFDGRFLGYADFIERSGTADDGTAVYEVYDSKLARKAKITALLQLAAYSEQLHTIGVSTGEQVHLILGDGKQSSHRLDDILPVYRLRRARLEQIIDERVADAVASEWGDPRYAACGRCDACQEQIELHRDVLLTAGLRLTQRARLFEAGIATIDQLAAVTKPVPGVTNWRALQTQAAVQLASTDATPAWRIADARALGALPHPDDGDIFFDFEGDPLYQEGSAWGLDYLFGLVEADGTFVPFWAHDLSQERQALIDFVAYLRERRERHPRMHVYHYAAYERTHLLSLAARHGYGEEFIADLLRDHLLVDLYPIVRRSLVIGRHSYSLKKLEPLYMHDARIGTANAADSVSEYARYATLAPTDPDAAAAVLDDIARYNAYDCLSTLRLRDWLLARAADEGIALAAPADLEIARVERETDPLFEMLSALIADTPPADRTPDQTAIALTAAAIDYHRRENNTFWWDHYDRLRSDLDAWADTRDVLIIDPETIELVRGWSVEGRARTASRAFAVRGELAPGSALGAGPFLVYDEPFPPNDDNIEPGARYAHDRAQVVAIDDGTYTVVERLKTGQQEYDQYPIALAPPKPPNSATLAASISEWGERVLGEWPTMLPDAALDILRRQAPRGTIARTGATIDDIRDTLLSLDHSYVAVQGPPGTGKTFTGSHVIADLVANSGWKVGVVAQSHAAVENMLQGIIDAGLERDLVGKKPRAGDGRAVDWTLLSDSSQAAFTAKDAFVIGGTAWTFANRARLPLDSLDLLVIDEAGQYSLANTIAAAGAARRLLLLGDPQQLPQVSQGQHPEPVDVSALGWLSAGHDVLPTEFGYFLDTSWRMHPDLCAPVSRLSYEGRLTSHPSDRMLEGVEPGLHPVPVDHWGNSTSSVEEAASVVELIDGLLGKNWCGRPLDQNDVIVVAPYNAHVALLRESLDAAALTAVNVGTVDRFQGQEAAIAIVSLGASSAADVPRGIDFLLLANRLNVAISRAQWAAYLIYSPGLTEYLPSSVEGLARLSAFVRLVEG